MLKYDGYRIGCRIDRGRVTLLSRKGNDWTASFPEIARAGAALKVKSARLDGEVCSVLPDGRTSFQALQNVGSKSGRLGRKFVIGGFTGPEGSRQGIGALLVGYYDKDAFVFAGKVGTGFTTKSARDLRGSR